MTLHVQKRRFLVKKGEWKNYVGEATVKGSEMINGVWGYHLKFDLSGRDRFQWFPVSQLTRTNALTTVPSFEIGKGVKLGAKPAGQVPNSIPEE